MNKSSNSNIDGFSLIEVLIAVFVIAIGVLGVSSAQLLSLKNNQSAYYRSQANFLMMDMFDRMRANPEGVQGNHYDDIDTADIDPDHSLPACASDAAGCSPQQIAEMDKRQWAEYFTGNDSVGLIPGSKGVVDTDVSGAVTTVTVTVTWSESAWDDDPDGDPDTADGSFGDTTGRVSMRLRL